MSCSGFHVSELKKINKLDPRAVIGTTQIKGIQGLSEVERGKAIYAAHAKQTVNYKSIKLYSAYLGEIYVDVYDVGNGWVAMQTIIKGLSGKPDIFVKEVDAVYHRLHPDRYTYDINYLAQIQPSFINIKKCLDNGKIIEKLECKNKLLALEGKELNDIEKQQLHTARIYNNVVDIHFNACNSVDFLHKIANTNNVTNSNIMLSIHNVPHIDNAFWTGDNGYMVYGNGDKLFQPLGTTDIGGHESGHGCVGNLAGLRYRGESGALNEHFADIIGVCNEFFTYYKYNSNLDGNTDNDINGKSDWLIGEDAGKHIKYLRNMADPHKADQPQPKHYKGKYWGDPNDENIDHGYVHFNSGVGNWCFYNVSIKIGWIAAFKIFWKCLEQLGPDSSYTDYRDYLKLCAGDHLDVVKSALLKVGLGDHIMSDWVA
jgi:Zn-dependent metalloprotease